MRAPLVVVSGPPASGKTAVALPLARALALPLVAKDTVKEALMDVLGAEDLERSRELSRAAFAVILAMARSHLDTGVGVVLEANFSLGASERDLLPLVDGSGAVVVHCWAPPEVLEARYRGRAPHRHPGHQDVPRLARGLPWLVPPATEPPGLGVPCLRVDTSGPWDIAGIAAWVRAELD